MNLKLIRLSEYGDATLGTLLIDGWPEYCTLEERWKENEPKVSCIPEGTYRLKKVSSPKFGPTYEIVNVPDRSHILFHWGNTTKDTEGCILLGYRFDSSGDTAVRDSKAAFTHFFDDLKMHEELLITIVSTV